MFHIRGLSRVAWGPTWGQGRSHLSSWRNTNCYRQIGDASRITELVHWVLHDFWLAAKAGHDP